MKYKTIAICCSASFYRQALEAQEILQHQGYKVYIPYTAGIMKKRGDFKVEHYKTWYKNPKDYTRKARLMRLHFSKILKSDAIVVLNYEKKGMKGYIGGNTLMEMAIAFHYKKPIYVLNPVDKTSLLYEEILGMNPVFLQGNLKKL
jgi:diphthamide synthase subunit DPH2